jgi:hypothetical protein
MRTTLFLSLPFLFWSLAACSGSVEVSSGGSSGSGGSGGSGASSGGPVCPAEEPIGQACDVPAVRCTYGDSVRPECRNDWTCLNGQWTTTKSVCLEPAMCPAAMPEGGSDCSPQGDVCTYDATICECNACSGGPCMPFPVWSCHSPPGSGCPVIVPNDGSACDDPSLVCTYGEPCGLSGATVQCTDGAWLWVVIPCPL